MSFNQKNFTRTKYACYTAYLTMASVFSLPPLLFVTLREMYGISYTLLGTLVLINFCSQMTIDLIFTFFAKYFNIKKVTKAMPILTCVGMMFYALTPWLFPHHIYIGLLSGTILFSVSSGLSEVLISPLVAAIPSDNPDRDMSLLHSLYAWGVVSVIVISTVFLRIAGRENWMYLTMFWAVLPLIPFVMFCTAPIPEMNLSHETGHGSQGQRKRFGLVLCAVCIFLGSAAENAMTNWISGYMETALRLPKLTGDILGMAAFAVLLGLGRILYAKYGKNISSVLLLGMAGAAVCYLIAGTSPFPALSMIACVLTGLCTSMLWPGTLIMMEEHFPGCGVTAYALMAAGGDLGGSVAPQLLGAVVDAVSANPRTAELGAALSLTAEQCGMKVGMLTAGLFPLLGVILLIYLKKYFSRHPEQ